MPATSSRFPEESNGSDQMAVEADQVQQEHLQGHHLQHGQDLHHDQQPREHDGLLGGVAQHCQEELQYCFWPGSRSPRCSTLWWGSVLHRNGVDHF